VSAYSFPLCVYFVYHCHGCTWPIMF